MMKLGAVALFSLLLGSSGFTAQDDFKPLPTGSKAPDFTVYSPSGKALHLSDFKGKVVLLDFWATWCGPCQVSMPGLEKIYKSVKKQGVVVLSVNTWDEKPAFKSWIKENSGTKYHFTFGYDPAGRGDNSIAGKKYKVDGIPTMYIIDRQGKVSGAVVGSGNEVNIVSNLKKLGVEAGK